MFFSKKLNKQAGKPQSQRGFGAFLFVWDVSGYTGGIRQCKAL